MRTKSVTSRYKECSGVDSDRYSVLAHLPRELEADRAPAISDHHLRQQGVQLVQISRSELVALIDEMALKLTGGAQTAPALGE